MVLAFRPPRPLAGSVAPLPCRPRSDEAGRAAPIPLPFRRAAAMAARSALAALALAGCGGGGDAPELLLDGSPARPPPVRLEGAPGPVVLTSVRVVASPSRSPRARSCLAEARPGPARGPAVERVGVDWESVTLRMRSGTALAACDDTPGPRVEGRRWCGGAYGELEGGRLRDPRLDVLCRDADGDRAAFVWVEPGPRTRWVVVRREGFSEAYPTAARLPVRVFASGAVAEDPLSATLSLSEHDAAGRLLRRFELHARPAG